MAFVGTARLHGIVGFTKSQAFCIHFFVQLWWFHFKRKCQTVKTVTEYWELNPSFAKEAGFLLEAILSLSA